MIENFSTWAWPISGLLSPSQDSGGAHRYCERLPRTRRWGAAGEIAGAM
jgi:hypothetical protein